VLWAAKVAKMGYRWKLGNGQKVRFWEDVWVGNSSLAIQFWEIYVIINEQNKTMAELWDGVNLKCTFKRCVNVRLFNMWQEVVNIASTAIFSSVEDETIWQFHSSGVYSSHSLYRIINFRGVMPVFIPAVWNLIIPPRVQFFLWLLSKDKILTRDNLRKRRNVDNPSCLFCEEEEIWEVIYEVLGVKIGVNYESMASFWLCNKQFGICNMFSAAVCWNLWKIRIFLCFQSGAWVSMKSVWFRLVPMIRP
jgi:hypothetical protein